MSSKVMFIYTTVATSIAVFVGAYWPQSANVAMFRAASVSEHAHTSSGMATEHTYTKADAPDYVQFTVKPETPRPGEPALLSFKLTDASGEPIGTLVTHHDHKLHVLIVSEDMHVFGHVHPADFDRAIEHGVAEVSFPFPQTGRYLIGVDFMTDRSSHVAQFMIEVTGPERAAYTADAAASPTVRTVEIDDGDRYTRPIFLCGMDGTDGYAVSLQVPDDVRAGSPVRLVYHFSRHRAPLMDLRPYLAAPLHLAIVKDDLTLLLHEHGTVSMPGRSGHPGHGDHESPVPAAFGPEVTATVTFPVPGTYYLFGQATHGDKLLSTRFSIQVH